MAALVVVLIAVLVAVLLVVHRRFTEMEERVAELTRRLYRLERAGEPLKPSAAPEMPPPLPMPTAVPEPVLVEPPPLPLAYARGSETRAPEPSLSDRIRQAMGNDEWEALVGGSILNKLGAVVLVIGIALFLAWSFSHITAAGRAGMAIAASATLLATGIWVETKAKYRAFSRGLIGAGWAALYATSYAIYALPAARIIENPFVGSVVMLLTAAAMILYSLRYRSQAVTAIAYFAAFAALAATPSTPFAVVSLIPLAVSILYLASVFEWHAMALFGMVATYATCISRGNSDVPLASTETLFLAYWILFEAFDLLRVSRRLDRHGLEWIFPLNSAAFLWLSYIAWAHHAPDRLWAAAACAAAMYLGDAIARAVIRPPSSFAERCTLLDRVAGGSYEGALMISAVLAGLAIVGRVPGVWQSAGLAMECELIYLAGVRLRAPFLRAFGGGAFAFSLASLAWHGAAGGTAPVLGHAVRGWTPGALFHAFLFYLNRGLFRASEVFSYAASGLTALVLAAECPRDFIGIAWLAFALVLLEAGLRLRRAEFRFQAYGVLALGAAAVVATHFGAFAKYPPAAVSVSFFAVAACAWLFTARTMRTASGRDATATLGTLFVLPAIWLVLPDAAAAICWAALAVAWVELGVHLPLRPFRLLGQAVTIPAVVFVLLMSQHRMTAAVPLAAALYYLWSRLRSGEESLSRVHLWSAAAVVLAAIATDAGWERISVGWTLFSLAVLLAGRRLSVPDFRWQSYLSALLAFSVAIWNSSPAAEAGSGKRIAVTAAVIATFYAAEFCAEGPARNMFSALGTVLLMALLWHEVSGGLLTVAYGVLGLALLAAGFPSRERTLRLEGLALLLACILKLFLYDLRSLETLYRILSFVALGIILLGVSWIYTRFRERLKRYL